MTAAKLCGQMTFNVPNGGFGSGLGFSVSVIFAVLPAMIVTVAVASSHRGSTNVIWCCPGAIKYFLDEANRAAGPKYWPSTYTAALSGVTLTLRYRSEERRVGK